MDSRSEQLRQNAINLYNESFHSGKTFSERVRYGNSTNQYVRFSEIKKFIESNDVSIVDIGCGNAEFYDFIIHQGFTGKYTGIDLNRNLLSEARQRFPFAEFIEIDVSHAEQNAKYDYAVMSGLFNADFGQDADFVRNVISKMFSMSTNKAIFNAIGTYTNFKSEGMFYVDLCITIDFIITKLSPLVEVRHGFLPCNYTIAISHRI